MTYRGIVSNGVVVLEGQRPSEGTVVDVTPVADATSEAGSLANDPAVGMWKDRRDLPDDPVQASKVLRQRLMRRADD
jgi:hypothetical protein